MHAPAALAAAALLWPAGFAAELSTSAYRVLGQRGFQQSGVNLVSGFELNTPSGIAIDSRGGNVRLYIADSGNNRVLGYADARAYQAGDPPSLLLGQPGAGFSTANGLGALGLNAPLGLAVDPNTGNLYVADLGNNRILRYPDPFSNPGRVEPDGVLGQPSFTTSAAQTTRNGLNRPRALAFDSGGNLWVADTGNHRIVRFSAAVLDTPAGADADAVIGQADFFSSAVNAGGQISGSGFDQPAGIAFDAQDNLYVADFNNARVLRFSRQAGAGVSPSASAVWGQTDTRTRAIPIQVTPTRLAGPVGVAVDSAGNLFVSCTADNRVLGFPAGGSSTPNFLLGQQEFTTNTANSGSTPRASATSLSAPTEVRLDPAGTVYVVDSNNHRVLAFTARSRSASRVWGQLDFTANFVNQTKPAGLNSPARAAVDYSQQPFVLYVADAGNNRILGWRDAARYRDGDPADLVIGQPDLFSALPNPDSANPSIPSRTSLSSPSGICVDPLDGTLWVADSGNNRVLRFPRPASQAGRIVPDIVLGQIGFNQSTSARVSASTLNSPVSVALGPDRHLFISDTGNNRVLEFDADPGSGASAIRVYGQQDFNSANPATLVSAQTLNQPRGIFVDLSSGLYVADTGSNRVVLYPNTQGAPTSGAPAALVIGQNSFTSAAAGMLRSPTDVALDGDAGIYVADWANHRVLAFPAAFFLPPTGATPAAVVGQRDLTATAPNWESPLRQASASSLFGPAALFVDRQDTLYVSEVGNNRVLHFLKRAVFANAATGQPGSIAPGGIVSLAGSNLASEAPSTSNPVVWSDKLPGDWPKSVSGREIAVNDDVVAPIYQLQAQAAIFQLPQLTPLGTSRVAVRVADTGELVAGSRIPVAASAPGLFTMNNSAQAVAQNEDGRANSATNPAGRGTVITLTGTGQGQVSPPVLDGASASEEPLSRTVTVLASDVRGCSGAQALCVVFGNTFGEIQSSGLAPGYVGIWQIKVKIPLNAAPGTAVPVRAVINGAPSNTVMVAIR